MKQIDFTDIQQNSKKYFSELDFSGSSYSPTIIHSKNEIRNIIKSMINIQSLLARQYIYRRDFGFYDSVDFSYFLTDNIDTEIRMFTCIFNEVFVLKDKSVQIPFSIQVSNVNDLAYDIFVEMLSEDETDRYIKHFVYNRTFKQDFSQTAFFEIERQEHVQIKNKYFDYLIEGTISPTMLNPLYIDVSGFKMDEIESDEYVQQLSAQVQHLYLVVFKQGPPELTFYTKQLRLYV